MQKKGTFLFNAIVLLSLNSLLLPPGSCLMAWMAWWQYQLKESWSSKDVCYHPPQTAIFPDLCQACCLWSCAGHWIREAIQIKNNPVGWLGAARALAIQDNLQSQIGESCLPLQDVTKAQPRRYLFNTKNMNLSASEGALGMRRQESFAHVHKGHESKPHCAQMAAQNIFTQALL